MPGSTRDGSLHLLQSSKTVTKTDHDRVVAEQEIVLPDTGERGLNTVFKTTDIAIQRGSSTEETITVTAQYPDGSPSVVSLETRKSDKPLHH